MGMISTLFKGPPKPQIVKPLPEKTKSKDTLGGQNAYRGNSTILTSGLGLGDSNSGATTLLGS